MLTLPATTVDFFLAGLESFMIRSGQGMHRAVTMLRLEGKPDREMLTQAWGQVHARHPMLGARLKRSWRGWRLMWKTEGPVQAPSIVWHPPQNLPPCDPVIQERLQGRYDSGEIVTPLFLEVFPWGDASAHVILLTWRHALMDGTGVNLLLEKLAGGACEAGPPEFVPPKRENVGRAFKRAQPLIKRLHAMTRSGCLSAWIKGMPNTGAPAFQLLELSSGQSQAAFIRLRQFCGDFLQMPFYAAIAARAVRRLHVMRGWRSPEIHLQLPSQARGRNTDLIFGNHMGTLPLFLDSDTLGTMDEAVRHLLEKYREAMKQDMPRASEALMALASQMPVKWFIPSVRLTNRGQICSLFHSHTGAFLPARTDFAGAAIQNICTIPGVSSPPGFGVFFSDYAGRITVTLAWRGDNLSEAEIRDLSRQILADLTGQQEV
jgi:hypothetical protein